MIENVKDYDFKNKVDLLKFQTNLNNQFLNIFNQKKASESYSENSETSGLISEINNCLFFVDLKDLKSIATKIKYENSIKTHSWILGFNQEHGNIYTILNLNKLIIFLIKNKTDFDAPRISVDSNVVYIREVHKEDFFGFFLENFKITYLENKDSFFEVREIEENKFGWHSLKEKNENIIEKIFNSNDEEMSLIKQIAEQVKINKYFSYSNFKVENESTKTLLFNKIYVDSLTKRPIFVLNIENIIYFLKNELPI